MPRHKLTPDDRRRGQAKGAETKRARRDEAEQEARDTLADAAGEAVATLVSELKAENPADRIRAAAQILDRAWGRPRQQLEASVDSRLASSTPRSTRVGCSKAWPSSA